MSKITHGMQKAKFTKVSQLTIFAPDDRYELKIYLELWIRQSLPLSVRLKLVTVFSATEDFYISSLVVHVLFFVNGL